MYNSEYRDHHNTGHHVNAFIDLNNVPYLVAEYLDRDHFQQIDRSLIKSDVFIDQSESMRAVVDISIDDIGKRASDGLPAIIGNNTKHRRLIKMISDNYEILEHNLNVFKRGIIVRVNYQLENCRTHQVIRSMTEDFRIKDRNYFLDINPRDVDDNAIISNFCNTMVSTINEFTHGQDRMIIRITSVHMFYEMVKGTPKMPRIKQSIMSIDNYGTPAQYGMSDDLWNYHNKMQSRHCMSDCDPYDYENEDVSMISPSTWSMFNRFYHFGEDGRDVILHGSEINDPMTKIALIPCGTVNINRTFMINPGHRIIFKFCIWKNDLTVVSNTTKIAQALNAPVYDNQHDHNHHHHHNHHDDRYDDLIDMLSEFRSTDNKQNKVIKKLAKSVDELGKLVQGIVPPVEPEDPIPCCPECDEEHDILNSKIDKIIQEKSKLVQKVKEVDKENDEFDERITEINTIVESMPNLKSLTEEQIKEIVDANS